MSRHILVPRDRKHLKEMVRFEMNAHGNACDLNHIDVSCISSFEALFKNSPFVGDISAWDMRAARTTVDMFYGSAFNGDISRWNVERLRNANHMFHESVFNGDIARWNPINLESADFMFAQSPFAGDVADWHLPFLNSCMHMFDTPAFHGDLSASREVVRWATEMGELGRAMGLEHEALVQLMVQAYPNRVEASKTIVEAHAFEAPL